MRHTLAPSKNAFFRQRYGLFVKFSNMGALKSKRCSRGHLLAGRNLYMRKDGSRECLRCSLERATKFMWNKIRDRRSRLHKSR